MRRRNEPAMRLLGAILAGGRSRRFGTDKAVAQWNGAPLLAHCVAALSPQVDHVVLCGREWEIGRAHV